MRRTAALLLVLLLAGGCGMSRTTATGSGPDVGRPPVTRPPTTDGPTTDPPTTDGPTTPPTTGPHETGGYPHGADAVLIDVYEGPGGFGPYNPAAEHLPSFRLYGDGTLVASSYRPRTARSGTGTPDLRRASLSEADVRRLLAQAAAAGLDGRHDPDYGSPGVTDLGTTEAEVTTGAGTSKGSAYALGVEDDDTIPISGVSPDQVRARRALSRLIDDLDASAKGAPRLAPAGYAVVSSELGTGFRRDDVRVEAWPLEDPSHGAPDGTRTRCQIAAPDDIRKLEAAVPDALRPDPPIAAWTAPSGTYLIGLRPLLPDEHTCEDIAS